jgi:hypothetical protein
VPGSGSGWANRLLRALVEACGHDLTGRDDSVEPPGPGTPDTTGLQVAEAVALQRAAEAVRKLKCSWLVPPEEPPHAMSFLVVRDLADTLWSQWSKLTLPPEDRVVALRDFVVPRALRLARTVPGSSASRQVVRYERLIEAPIEELRRWSEFLGMTIAEEWLVEVAREHTFQAESGRRAGDELPGAYHRKGVTGDGRRLPAGLRDQVAGACAEFGAWLDGVAPVGA